MNIIGAFFGIVLVFTFVGIIVNLAERKADERKFQVEEKQNKTIRKVLGHVWANGWLHRDAARTAEAIASAAEAIDATPVKDMAIDEALEKLKEK